MSNTTFHLDPAELAAPDLLDLLEIALKSPGMRILRERIGQSPHRPRRYVMVVLLVLRARAGPAALDKAPPPIIRWRVHRRRRAA